MLLLTSGIQVRQVSTWERNNMAKVIIGYDSKGPIYEDDERNTSSKNQGTPTQTPPQNKPLPKDPGTPKVAPEPEFLMPGSKSEAAVRGFSNAATLGMAPRISAWLRSQGGAGDSETLRKEYLDADRAAAEAHPVVSGVASLVGGAPSMLAAGAGGLGLQVAKNAGLGAINAVGNSPSEAGAGLVSDAAMGAGIQGALTAALPVGGKLIGKGMDFIRGKPNIKEIGEAAIKFKNAQVAPASTATGSSSDAAQLELQKTFNTRANRDASGRLIGEYGPTTGQKPFLDAQAVARGDETIRESARAAALSKLRGNDRFEAELLDPEILKKVIAEHNYINSGEAGRTIGGSAIGGAALGAVPTFIGTGGDLNATAGAAAAGAVGGATAGAKYNAIRNTSKLRLPDNIPRIPGAGVANTVAATAASRELSDKFGVPSSPFGKISDYLSSQGIEDPTDVEKRQAGMATQNTSKADN